MKKVLFFVIVTTIISILFLWATFAMGQPPVQEWTPFAPGAPPPPNSLEIPIDGGLSMLIMAGLAYGARKLYKERDRENTV